MRFQVEAILFDIDGTLVDSTAVVERSWRAWAELHHLDAEVILAICHGRRSEDTIAMFLPPDRVGSAVAELTAFEMDFLAEVVALPGAQEMLAGLPPERWAVVTSGPLELMRARLAVSGLPIPQVMVTAEDVAAGKPDPQGYLKAASGLGRDPRDCLVVEDAAVGVAAGRAAGASVLALTTTHRIDELALADAIAPDLSFCRVESDGDGLLFSVNV